MALNVTTAVIGSGCNTATATPSNTTDTILWSSSNTSVATVNNGTVTAAGCGSATITATCGTQTATCTVTVTSALAFTYGLGKFADLPTNRLYVRINGSDNAYAAAYSATSLTGKKMIIDQVSYQNMWAAELSPGATKINFTIPSTHRVTVFFVDENTGSSASGKEAYAQMIDGDASRGDTNVPLGDREVTIPEGANAVTFTIQYPGNTVTAETMAAITVVQS